MILGVLYRTLLAATTSRARVLGFAAVGVIEILVAVLLASQDVVDATELAVQLIDKFGLTLIVPLAALVFGTAALGDPIEDGTYVYLWLRPSGRWRLTITAYLATLTSVVPLAVVPTVIAGVIADPSVDVAVGAMLASLLAALAYSAVFVLLGQLTSRALIWGVAYLLIFEQFISRGGRGLGFISVHSHAASVLAGVLDHPVSLGYFSLATGVITPIVFTAAWVGWSVFRQDRMSVA